MLTGSGAGTWTMTTLKWTVFVSSGISLARMGLLVAHRQFQKDVAEEIQQR